MELLRFWPLEVNRGVGLGLGSVKQTVHSPWPLRSTLHLVLLQSKVEAATFWSRLGELKLHDLKLGEGPVPLRASWAPSRHTSQPGLLTVRAASLPADGSSTALALAPGGGGDFELAGEVYVLNTAERILSFDRKAAVQQVGRRARRAGIPWCLHCGCCLAALDTSR